MSYMKNKKYLNFNNEDSIQTSRYDYNYTPYSLVGHGYKNNIPQHVLNIMDKFVNNYNLDEHLNGNGLFGDIKKKAVSIGKSL